MGSIFQTLIEHGHDIYKVKHDYTTDQVYLFYKECVKRELSMQRSNAVAHAQAGNYFTPAYDQKGARAKQAAWKKYMDSLDWEKLNNKQNFGTVGGWLKMFSTSGIMIKK